MTITDLTKVLAPNFNTMPDYMKALPQWILWKAEYNKKKGDYSKVPYQLNGHKASSTNPNTWNTFEAVRAAYEFGGYEGVGFCMSQTDRLVCIDLDGIEDINRLSAEFFAIAQNGYTEISPSGTGLHVWVLGSKPPQCGSKKNDIEFYDGARGRYITMTGHRYGNHKDLVEGQKIIDMIAERYFKNEEKAIISPTQQQVTVKSTPATERVTLSDSEIIEKLRQFDTDAFNIYQGDFSSKLGDHSRAVASLLSSLAYWTSKDAKQMDRIIRTMNGLNHEKWDRNQNGSTWGAIEIENAINRKKATYSDSIAIRLHSDTVEQLPTWWQLNPNGTKTFLHHKLASEVMNSYSLVRYPSAHGSIYYFNTKKGIYEEDKSGNVLQGIIRTFDKENLKSQHIREVYQYIQQLSSVVSKVSDTHIAVGNGHLNLLTCELEEFSPANFVIQKIPTNYNPAAESAFVDDTLLKVTQRHQPTIENIKEMFACVLYPKILVPKMFYLYGRTAHNGKSSILNMIHTTFNKDGGNISAVSPQKLATNTFASASIYGKLANIVDDQPDQIIEDSGALRTIITGGYIEVERKGKDSETVKMDTVMITASNYFPNFKENGKQINRRLYIIPFEHDFSRDETRMSDSHTLQLISSTQTTEYVLKLAVDKLKEMLSNNNPDKITVNEKAEQVAATFAEHSDPLSDYFDEYSKKYFEDHLGSLVRRDYEIWCENNGVIPLGAKRFKERVCTHYNMEWTQKRDKHGYGGKGFKSK